MDNATVIKLLESQKTDLKDLIEGQSAVISARVDAKFDQKFIPLEEGVKSILDHNKRQNGWIKEHTEKIVGLEKKTSDVNHYQKNCAANKVASKFSTTRFWIIASILTTVIYFILATVYHTIGIGTLINKLLGGVL